MGEQTELKTVKEQVVDLAVTEGTSCRFAHPSIPSFLSPFLPISLPPFPPLSDITASKSSHCRCPRRCGCGMLGRLGGICGRQIQSLVSENGHV